MKPICCICKKECENEWGNNPYPVSKNEKDRCCNKCNDEVVIPKRFEMLLDKKENKNE